MNEQQDNREEQIRRHHQKWKKWKLELKIKNQESKRSMNLTKQIQSIKMGKVGQNTQQYVKKLIQKLQGPQVKECPISKNVADELQANTCTICLQLMAPPSIPYILFPCGHNVCKICLFVGGETNKQKYKLNIEKCPMCRMSITNYAQNRNLTKLICSYINNKQLLERQIEHQAKQKQQRDNITKLNQHCILLENEKKVLTQQIQDHKKNRKILEEVIERLLDERRRCRKQLDALQQQSRLVNKHINQKEQQIEKVQTKIINLEQRNKNLQQTLRPLKTMRQKLQIQEASKLINKTK